jgi:hypothetical protein
MYAYVKKTLVLGAVLASMSMANRSLAQDLAASPPMGWNSWNFFNNKRHGGFARFYRHARRGICLCEY